MHHKARSILGRAALGLVALGVLAMPLADSSAQATTATTGNPWTWTVTNPNADGMVINGTAGSLKQIWTIKDHFGAPIASVGEVGGLGVYGDRLAIFPPSSVTNPVIVLGDDGRISITGPNAGVYIDGQLLTSSDIAYLHSLQGKP